VLLSKLFGVADDASTANTFDVTSIVQAIGSGSQTAANIDIAFNERANAIVANITLVTT
jgi:hypothetical protein